MARYRPLPNMRRNIQPDDEEPSNGGGVVRTRRVTIIRLLFILLGVVTVRRFNIIQAVMNAPLGLRQSLLTALAITATIIGWIQLGVKRKEGPRVYRQWRVHMPRLLPGLTLMLAIDLGLGVVCLWPSLGLLTLPALFILGFSLQNALCFL